MHPRAPLRPEINTALQKAASKDWEAKSPLLSGDWTRHQDRRRWWKAGRGGESEEEREEEREKTGQELGDALLSQWGDREGVLPAVPPASSSLALTVSKVSAVR